MAANMENSIRQEQVESFGRLMAGLAHDMKNHLGIIRESNGLMGDILEMGALGDDTKTIERLQKSIAAIERRIVISANMMHHLSGLAHRSDSPYSSFSINDLIEEEYTLLERFSRLKQIKIIMELQETLPTMYNDPSLLQHIFYRIYSGCLELLESDQCLIIFTEQEEQSVVIAFHFPSRNFLTDGKKIINETLLAAVAKVSGTLQIAERETNIAEIRLTVSSLGTGTK